MSAKTLTIAELKAMSKEHLTPAEVAQVSGMDANWLRLAARKDEKNRGVLGYHPLIKFPFQIVNSRIHFPRLAFIRWMEGADDEITSLVRSLPPDQQAKVLRIVRKFIESEGAES